MKYDTLASLVVTRTSCAITPSEVTPCYKKIHSITKRNAQAATVQECSITHVKHTDIEM